MANPDSPALPHLVDFGKLDLHVAARYGVIDSAEHGNDLALDPRPARRGQDDNSDVPRAEVLLVLQVPIGRDENLESFTFGSF